MYCRNNPVSAADKDGELPTFIVGALIGAAISATCDIASQLIGGATLDTLDWKSVTSEAISGAVTGAMVASGVKPSAANIIGSAVKTVSYGIMTKQSSSQIITNTVGAVLKTAAIETIGGVTGKALTSMASGKHSAQSSKFIQYFYPGKHVATNTSRALVQKTTTNSAANGSSLVGWSMFSWLVRKWRR